MPGQGPGLFRQTHLIASVLRTGYLSLWWPMASSSRTPPPRVYIYNNEDQQLQKVRAPSRAQRELSNLAICSLTEPAVGTLTPSSRF